MTEDAGENEGGVGRGGWEGGPGAQPNKTKNGSPFTMPRIYIISRNLRHFRSSRFALSRASAKEGGRGGRNGSEINLRGAAVFPGRATESPKERAPLCERKIRERKINRPDAPRMRVMPRFAVNY